MTKVAILGAGQIGRAVYSILLDIRYKLHKKRFGTWFDAFVLDSNVDNVSKLESGTHRVLNFEAESIENISKIFQDEKVTHIINALPFFLNEKIAKAACKSGCHYIDFTEDDKMADKVQDIYKDSNLTCIVKCGLAPGFINYIGYNLITKIDVPDTLMISVGALPRTVSFSHCNPEDSYNLTWSLDGLVNEYIRPCRVRKNGKIQEIMPIGELTRVIIDGTIYEAAYTSGGIGSLVKDLTNVPNVYYMTLRYPGHYRYVKEIVQQHAGKFDEIKKTFSEKFAITDDDVIIVYANALGKDKNNRLVRHSYSNKFYGTRGLTGIQATTASSGAAIFELMITGTIKGLLNHKDISVQDFMNTESFKEYYKNSR